VSSSSVSNRSESSTRVRPRHVLRFTFLLLAIEFLDELVFGAREAAWPLIRDDLNLTYAQVGLLLSVPAIIANLIEPPLGILADVWNRRVLVLGGGIMFGVALALTAGAPSFSVLLLSFVLFYPASGAFVSLSQATLMDLHPHRHEQMMARWNLAGSLGVVAGALALTIVAAVALGWRGLFAGMAGLAFLLTLVAWRQPFLTPARGGEPVSFVAGVGAGMEAIRRPTVLRWLLLLEVADLTHDVLLGFLALYLVDVAGFTPALAATAVAIRMGGGLLGDVLLVPLLSRVRGLVYLRYSAVAVLLMYPSFLLASSLSLKLALLAGIAIFGAGWYPILKGQLYSAIRGRSGTVMAVSSAAGVLGGLVPLGLGALAAQWGLGSAVWLLALGPLVLLLGISRVEGQD
jgi:MFS transporter, FSR family, fosmidomycin resistance protein